MQFCFNVSCVSPVTRYAHADRVYIRIVQDTDTDGLLRFRINLSDAPDYRPAIDLTEHCLEISAVTAAAVASPVKSSDRTLRVH